MHNFLLKTSKETYCPKHFVDDENAKVANAGECRQDACATTAMQSLQTAWSKKYCWEARTIRDEFKQYICSAEGSVDWQLNMVTRFR